MNWVRRHALIIASVLGVSAIVTGVIVSPTGVGVKAATGDVAKATYRAPRTVTYKSDLKTEEAEKKAAQEIAPIYRRDPTAASQQSAKFSAAVAAIDGARGQALAPTRIRRVLSGLTEQESQAIAALPEADWQSAQDYARSALSALQRGRVTPDDLGRADQLVSSHIPQEIAPQVRNVAIILGGHLLIPDYSVDEEQTEAARQKATTVVEPVSYTVEKDQVVAYKGQVLSGLDIERLQAVGLTRPSFNLQRTLGVAILVLLFTTLLLYVAPRYVPGERNPLRTNLLLVSFAIFLSLGGVLAAPTQPILAYVFPVASPVLLLAIFYGFDFAIIAGVCLTALYALASGGSFELFFIHLGATIGAIIFAGRIRTITGFLRAGALVALLVFVGMVGFKLLAGTFVLIGAGAQSDLPKFLLAAALNGALTAVFVFAGVAFLGNLLGRVTFLQLLELENPRHPLLRRLSGEAPGTYSHSLRMASIVETVAGKVGADPLLARVQTLYHDIGKTGFPEYFVENQRGENPHANLTPRESADILRAHISEGIILAREYGLPQEVAAAIPEHHGTTVMGYFWDTAKRGNRRAKEADFRYLGPRPRSKETAIIMLADAVEAASRTLDDPSEKDIQKLIHNLFTARIDDGQLDQAPLSTKELSVMKAAFGEAVVNELHKRIKYPKKK